MLAGTRPSEAMATGEVLGVLDAARIDGGGIEWSIRNITDANMLIAADAARLKIFF